MSQAFDVSAVDTTPPAVHVVGILDVQRWNKKEQSSVTRYNQLAGRSEQIVIQVPSPYKIPFQLLAQLSPHITLQDALPAPAAGNDTDEESADPTGNGTSRPTVVLTGVLSWQMREDTRYAVSANDQGRRFGEVIFQADSLRLATPADPPLGCVVRQTGVVLHPPRFVRHPDTLDELAVVPLRVLSNCTYQGSRIAIPQMVTVQVAIPIQHPEAPLLYRPHNGVTIEGLLEQVRVPLRGEDVTRALAARDAQWAETEATLEAGTEAHRKQAKAYRKDRERLQHVVRTRVVAGHVTLESGEPMTLEEAMESAKADQQRRRANQAANVESPSEDQPPVEESSNGSQPVRPRRRGGTSETPTPDPLPESTTD